MKEQFSDSSANYQFWRSLSEDMKKALSKKADFIKQPEWGEDAIEGSSSEYRKTPKHIYFLTDAHCGSACLNLADVLLALPGVTHVGQETSVDTVYMDIRMLSLPSGVGEFSLAQKVYRNRPLGHNESYIPEIIYTDNIQDTPLLNRWFRSKVFIN